MTRSSRNRTFSSELSDRAGAFHLVLAVLVVFGRRRIEGDVDVLTRRVARGFDGAGDETERFVGRFEARREAALVADIGVVALGAERLLEGMEHLGAHAYGFCERGCAGRLDHEFLHVDRIVSMHAAIDDVHHRHGQDAGAGATDIAIERQFRRFGGGLGDGERHAENGVGAQATLVGGAVQFDHRLVDADLVERVETGDFICNRVVDIVDGVHHALAEIFIAAIAQLDRFMHAGRCARRHGRAPEAAVIEQHIHFNGGVAAAV